MKKVRWGTFQDILFFLFLLGNICGCVTANLLGGELLRQIGYFDSVYRFSTEMGLKEKGQFWCYVLKRRIMEFGIGSLVGMTPLAFTAFAGLAAFFGFECGLLISVFTLRHGWMGIVLFLRTVLPHWLFYMAVWAGLAMGVKDGLDKMKVQGWFLLVLVILAGSIAEAFVNPLLLPKL